MTRLEILAGISAGVTVTAVSWVLLRPRRQLRKRVRPYAHVVRTRLLRGADPETYRALTRPSATMRDAFAPVIERLARLQSRFVGIRDEETLALQLRRSGLFPGMEPAQRIDAYRRQALARAGLIAGVLGVVGWNTRGAAGMAVYGIGGFLLGSYMSRGRLDSAIRKRRRRLQAELYTINQILAMRARAGGGVGDTLRHIANRGQGLVVSEIRETLQMARSGIPVTEALRRSAALTAEPEAARLYQSLAIAQERGVDLADALLALSRDLRTAKRDEAVTKAASRRIMAVVPIVVILAPIAIAFMAAPLPSLIFGSGAP